MVKMNLYEPVNDTLISKELVGKDINSIENLYLKFTLYKYESNKIFIVTDFGTILCLFDKDICIEALVMFNMKAERMKEFFNEPRETHTDLPGLKGKTKEEISIKYPNVNDLNMGNELEIYTKEGTIFCRMKGNVCIEAALYPHDENVETVDRGKAGSLSYNSLLDAQLLKQFTQIINNEPLS